MTFLIYCTKSAPHLRKNCVGIYWLNCTKNETKNRRLGIDMPPTLNGKIVASFEGDIERIIPPQEEFGTYKTEDLCEADIKAMSCLTYDELVRYNPRYAIHIDDLKILEKPMELTDFFSFNGSQVKLLTQAPQNMCRVVKRFGALREDELGSIPKTYALISIRPEWVAKILNGEKTIELRKKILKEAL